MENVLTGIGSMATRKLFADLIGQYERASGWRVNLTSVGGVEAARRVAEGEAFDFAVLATGALERLAAGGHVESARTDVVRSGVAVAVAAGAVRPDIGSSAALREALLAAKRVGYSTGPSGDYVLKMIERFGLADTLASRLVQAQPGVPVASLIARGEVDLGFQQLSELLGEAGIDIVGPLPDDVQYVTIFSAAICTASQQKEATARFLAFLASGDVAQIKRTHGMEPA